MDFLLQEMNREINTIGSKSSNIDVTSYVVDLKSQLEKVREQIQNIVNGVDIGGYVTRKCEIKLKKGSDNECYITIGEGKNRQVRKMFSS